jgi:hypothetical protein
MPVPVAAFCSPQRMLASVHSLHDIYACTDTHRGVFTVKLTISSYDLKSSRIMLLRLNNLLKIVQKTIILPQLQHVFINFLNKLTNHPRCILDKQRCQGEKKP